MTNRIVPFCIFCTIIFVGVAAYGACDITYENSSGTAGAGVGDSEDRNTYRGIYWTGVSKNICAVEVQLYVKGDISAINYHVTVWDVDLTGDLFLSTLLATSDIVSGAAIAEGWNRFTFASPVTLASGKTVVLISRVDAGVRDGVNRIQVLNGYDETDSESRQWNIHYGSNKEMAGRSPGDEDQPEYFTCNFRLAGVDAVIDSVLEYPNIPEDIQVTAIGGGQLKVEWVERGVNNVQVDHYNIYDYDETTAVKTLIGTSLLPSFTHTGLTENSVHTYVITAVSSSGNEGYRSLDNNDNWRATVVGSPEIINGIPGSAALPAAYLLML